MRKPTLCADFPIQLAIVFQICRCYGATAERRAVYPKDITVQQQVILLYFLCEAVMSIIMVDIVAVKPKKHKGKNKISNTFLISSLCFIIKGGKILNKKESTNALNKHSNIQRQLGEKPSAHIGSVA